jgi:hypothetical protein
MTRTRSVLVYASVAYLAAIFLLCAIAMTLGGCAGGLQGSPTVASQRMVYSAETDFEAALRLAVAYEQLPTCSATQKFPCSDPSTVTKVTAAAKAARASLLTAEAAVRSNSNASAMTTAALQAQQDVSVFTALANALGGK